jgi:glycosyltransferase involved in cell wall biosynthesis
VALTGPREPVDVDDRQAPMRLAFISDPNSVHTRRWLAWFAAAGHDVRLIDPFGATVAPGLPDGTRVERLPVPVRRVPVIGLWPRRRQLQRLLAQLDTQVLHGQFIRRYGWQAALSGFHPLVLSPWGSDLLKVRRSQVRTRWWNRFALRRADLVTVSSEGMRAASIRAGARPGRIELIHHGVDTDRFSPGPASAAIAARIAADGQPVIVSPRTIQPLYRQDVVVDAVARLSVGVQRPVIVLSARGADPAEVTRVQRLAEAAGIGGQLRVLDDVPHEGLPDLLRLADVVVSVPDSDSFPVTLLEAMACGRPIVASDLPAVTPVLREIEPLAGSLVAPVGDATLTARAIGRILALGADDRARLGERLRAYVVRTADYDTNMRAMERQYRRLATGR